MKNFIPYGRQFIDEDDIKAVKEILHLVLITQGPRIDEFEARVADFCQMPYAVAFNSGTSALHGAMYAAGIGEGDEVITTPLTFVATANAALYVGAKPVFVDIDRDNYCIDIEQIEAAITPRTKAIAPVDYAGYPVNISRIREIADKHNLVIIEDAAHALGAIRQGKMVGAEADMTMFSFHPVKHITTGEGGVIVCNNPEYYRRLKSFRSHGITKDTELLEGYPYPWYYEMQELGYNFRITDIQCALGISQMNKLEGFLSKRRLLAARYEQALGKLKWLRIPPTPSEGSLHAYHLYPLLLDADINRLDFYNYLKENNVGSQVHYFPVHLQPYYRKNFAYKVGDFPNAEDFYERQLSMPLFPGLTMEEQEWVIKVIEGYGG
ncbi:MAG: UDP-4-amino-4,6-dideoxy-N-acetyl-beta-L-altrosamine transaminase [Syntrophomonadaceae bacterium]|nr:UDP-4-amino-4,6-dideoxy-N-acetyl-beta-L-altrosamine transaminase [Syntrophomonadaceae bacterium]